MIDERYATKLENINEAKLTVALTRKVGDSDHSPTSEQIKFRLDYLIAEEAFDKVFSSATLAKPSLSVRLSTKKLTSFYTTIIQELEKAESELRMAYWRVLVAEQTREWSFTRIRRTSLAYDYVDDGPHPLEFIPESFSRSQRVGKSIDLLTNLRKTLGDMRKG